PPQKLATACVALDAALNGGLEHGQIHCISAEFDSPSKEVCHALLTSHLLASGKAQATVIDTTNSFDVKRLHGIVTASLKRSEEGTESVGLALEALERVRVIKAFDFTGLTECISELRDSLEGTISDRPEPARVAPDRATAGAIEDSDAEDEMLDVANDEEVVPTGKLPKLPPGKRAASRTVSASQSHFLIIDNIAHAAGPLLKSNHSQGQALLSSFMRSLSHLTGTHEIVTLLINLATIYPNATSTDSPSIFASCLLRPALGRSFPYMVDTHMLLHRLPLTADDAKAMYGTQAGGAGQRQARMVNVLEVLQDKYGSRVGRWAAFGTSAGGSLQPAK
ncbi:hypothetical protein LTR95_013722, partial [Oleoguttula sp. CCFEE 5521]